MKLPRLALAILLVVSLNVGARTGFFAYSRGMAYAQLNTLDSDMPSFENRLETDHFILKWTNKSRHSEDNIKDPQIIKDTAEYLEQAWTKYTELFGRKPYTAPGRDKIEVVFRDIDCFGVADPPDGPIQFNSDAWVHHKGIRQPTSAHELFHKMQYAYGYKTVWKPQRPYQWFTEGTAAWSEVFVWGRVSRTCKVDAIFKDTKMDLYHSDDMAMPFWIHFVQGNHEHPNNHLMVEFFEKCEQLHNERLALNEVIQKTYGPVDAFFNAFEKNRKNGFWSDTACPIPYRCILGPEGNDIVGEVKSFQGK
ncbi:MAG: hypothetical protein ABSF90_04235 [Syntrophobacteraceae bacterium]|jgi:hypothetical protein